MRSGVFGSVLAFRRAVFFDKTVDDFADGMDGIGSEVPASGVVRGGVPEGFGEHEITAQRFEHVLPRTDRSGIAHRGGASLLKRADAVRNQAVFRPVSAADDISRASGSDGASAFWREEGAAPGGDGDFTCAFAGRVGIVSAHRVVFAAAAQLFAVFVTLVGCDEDPRARGGGSPECFEHMNRAHDVGFVGFDRLFVGEPDERLGGEVEDDFRLEFIEDAVQMRRVADISPDVAHVCGESGENEVVALVFRVERISGNLRAEFAEPEAEP